MKVEEQVEVNKGGGFVVRVEGRYGWREVGGGFVVRVERR